MVIEQEKRGSVLTVRPMGRLDGASSPGLQQLLAEQFEQGVRRLVFDLSDLDYVSSAGLRAILMAGKELRASEGRLALAGVQERVRALFAVSGVDTLFAVLPTVDEAVAKVR